MKNSVVCLTILLLFGFQSDVVAQISVFEIKSALSRSLVITKYIEVFEDTSCVLTIQQVSSDESAERFHENKIEGRKYYDKQSGVVWGRFRLRNTTNRDVDVFLHGNWAQATLYRMQNDGSYTEQTSGVNVPLENKTIKPSSAVYSIFLRPLEEAQYYFRYENGNLLLLNKVQSIWLSSHERFYVNRESFVMYFMGFAGLELMMIVYAIGLYWVFRDNNYLWLCIALTSNVFYFLQYSGLASYVFTSEPWYGIFAKNGISLIYVPTMLIAQFHFLSTFLEWKKHSKSIHKWMLLLVYVVAAFTPLCYAAQIKTIGINGTNIGAIVFCILVVYVIIRQTMQGNPLAKLMLYSQGTLAVCVVISTAMSLFGLRGFPISSYYVIMIGYLSQSLLWTAAVIYKIVLLRKEKDKAQVDVISALQTNEMLIREQNVTLETRVEERTLELVEKNSIITEEKERSDALLLNILPSEVAEELKQTGFSAAKHFDNVSVLFTDFKEFAAISEQLSPQELVDELHTCFTVFDSIIGKYQIEKIKTIGDAYLAVCGLPLADPLHALNVVNAAIEIRTFMLERRKSMGKKTFEIRIGINSGSVVAGIVGVKKFAYDIWGDTVNTAARMEQNCAPGKINVSESTYELIRSQFDCEYRGEVDAKNKGKLKMYFVEAKSTAN